MNLCIFRGLILGNPHIGATSKGTPVMNFLLGVLDSNKNSIPMPVTIFGEKANLQAANIGKGSTIIVQGELRERTRMINGEEVKGLEVVAHEIVWIRECGPVAMPLDAEEIR